jgi:hypothetical protein
LLQIGLYFFLETKMSEGQFFRSQKKREMSDRMSDRMSERMTAAQLAACRRTPQDDYALEDVLKVLYPDREEGNKALLDVVQAYPGWFAQSMCLKQTSCNGLSVFVAPLEDAFKFADLKFESPPESPLEIPPEALPVSPPESLPEILPEGLPVSAPDVSTSGLDPFPGVNDNAPTTTILSVTSINEKELKECCRVTPDGKISVYDALAWRDKGTVDNAKKRYHRISMDRSVMTGPVSNHQFQSNHQPTPVAHFHEIIRLLAVIPGPGAALIRSQQAALSTRAIAGDWDLEHALQERREVLSADVQEVMLAGLEGSDNAKRLRQYQREDEEERKESIKRPRLSYSGEQLVQLVKDIGANVAPNPEMLSDMWEQCNGVHTDFMAQYVKYCEVRNRCCFYFFDLIFCPSISLIHLFFCVCSCK